MKKALFILLMVALAIGVYAVITGSAHDFTGVGDWNVGGEICQPCHTPHGADISVTDSPLWNHEVTVDTYTLYDSPTLDATMAQPAASSKLCLSCHDGTVALDNYGGVTTGTEFITTAITTLATEHPISFAYDGALVTADGGLHAHDDAAVAPLLIGGQVECGSCHDVHNDAGFTSLLRIQNTGSALCLTCHDK